MVRQLSYTFAMIFLFSFSFITSCTRQVERATSISLNIPSNVAGKVGALAATDLTHLIINVSGPGISPPAYLSWDSKEGANMPPASFTVDVLEGSDRLIQVLAIYKDPTTQDELFYYGDQKVSISSDSNVSIVVLQIGISLQKEAQIFGRYLPASGEPVQTGLVSMYYTPTGKPPMLIQQNEMFGGYFRLFGLDNVPFDYRLPSGVSMFGGPVDTTNTAIFQTANSLEVFMPAHYSQRCDNIGCNYESVSESKVIVGWFGPGKSTEQVCFPTTAPSINGMYADSSGTTSISWDPTYGGTTGSTPHPLTGLGVSATLDSEGLCAISLVSAVTGVRFSNFLSLDVENLANRDEIAGFRGPYAAKYVSGSGRREIFRLTPDLPSPGNLTLSWDYLPGARSDSVATPAIKGVDGSAVFYKDISLGGFSEDQIRVEDGVACGNLPGFTKLADVPASTDATTHVINGASAILTLIGSQDIVFVLCPYANTFDGRRYFKSGAVFRP